MGEGEYTMWSKLQARRNDSLEYWRDTAEGLACDLDSAIEVMAKRAWGTADTGSMAKWLALNYGNHRAVKDRVEAARAAKVSHIAGLKEAAEIVGSMYDTALAKGLYVAAITARINDLAGNRDG